MAAIQKVSKTEHFRWNERDGDEKLPIIKMFSSPLEHYLREKSSFEKKSVY